MVKTFVSKLLAYCLGDISKRKLQNCYNMIANHQNGNYTALQVITMKAELKTLRGRIKKEQSDLLEYFDKLFKQILNFEL